MSGKVVVVFGLLVALLLRDAVEAEEKSALQQLLSRREQVKARAERRAQLTEDEREIITKQIVQAISEVMNSDCMADRDYRGWVDFGRRDAE